MLQRRKKTHEEPDRPHIRAPPTHDWVAMNLAAATLPKHETAPAAERVSLTQAAKHSDTASVSILDRILTPGDKQRVEVASFQSSI